MKITGLKTFICDAFRMSYAFVKVETDAGIHGVGEATLEMSERTVAAAVHLLETMLPDVTEIRPADATPFYRRS